MRLIDGDAFRNYILKGKPIGLTICEYSENDIAYRNIKANRKSKTAGTDGRTIRDLEKLSEEKLVALVQRKLDWYEPQSVRRVNSRKAMTPPKSGHWGYRRYWTG